MCHGRCTPACYHIGQQAAQVKSTACGSVRRHACNAFQRKVADSSLDCLLIVAVASKLLFVKSDSTHCMWKQFTTVLSIVDAQFGVIAYTL